jgi:serine/threonine protein kinase
MSSRAEEVRQKVGHYSLHGEIGGGGMATVHFGRVVGAIGFTRTVAIKRLHRDYVRDPHFVTMFMDEARVAARVRHPNVVQTLDVVLDKDELFLVLEYVHGFSLAHLLRAAKDASVPVPAGVACAIIAGTLHGLHAAHEATDEDGEPLDIVHRDVSPQNILVGADGVARVLDFGVAKAAGRSQDTKEGQLKGKLAYMAPEQVTGVNVTRRCDVFAASIVFWELLTGARLFRSETESETVAKVLGAPIALPSSYRPELASLDVVVMKGLERDPEKRFESAREMARRVEAAMKIASVIEVSEWVDSLVGEELSTLSQRVAKMESGGGRVIAASTDADVDPMSTSSVVTRQEVPARRHSLTEQDPVTPVDVLPTKNRSGVLLFLLLAGFGAIGISAFEWRKAQTQRELAAEPVSVTTSPLPVNSSVSATATSPSIAATASPSTVDVTSLPQSVASQAAHPHHAGASHAAPSASVTAAAPVSAPTASVAPAPDCDPPYYEGSDGHRHYNPACFTKKPTP